MLAAIFSLLCLQLGTASAAVPSGLCKEASEGPAANPLAHWDPKFEKFLFAPSITLKQRVAVTERASQLAARVALPPLWTTEFLSNPDFPYIILGHYLQANLTIHEFFSGMIFWSAIQEHGSDAMTIGREPRFRWTTFDNTKLGTPGTHEALSNAKFGDQTMALRFHRRFQRVSPRERQVLEFSKSPNYGQFYFTFDDLAILGFQTERRTDIENAMIVRIASSTVIQLIADAKYDMESTQNVPVIGFQTAPELVSVLETGLTGGRSVRLAFPGVDDDHSRKIHGWKPLEYPLATLAHDLDHNRQSRGATPAFKKFVIPRLFTIAADVMRENGEPHDRLNGVLEWLTDFQERDIQLFMARVVSDAQPASIDWKYAVALLRDIRHDPTGFWKQEGVSVSIEAIERDSNLSNPKTATLLAEAKKD